MRCSLVSSERHSWSGIRLCNRRSPWLCVALLTLTTALAQPTFANPAHSASARPVSLERPAGRQWTHQARLNNPVQDALATLRSAQDHGLPEHRYAIARLNALAQNLAVGNNDQQFNELLTAALETYTLDLIQGLQPSAFENRGDPRYRKSAKHTVSSQLQAGVLKGLHRAIKTNRLSTFIRSIEPVHSDYQRLKDELNRYKAIAAHGGWPKVPGTNYGDALKAGVTDSSVTRLRARLAVTDNTLAPNNALNPEHYDQQLKKAVIRFQIGHGLRADGVIGKRTLAALNVSAAERVEQIKLNLDRWRLLPRVMPANHIWVNVPQFEMTLQLDRKEVLDMKVVVGHKKTPTPMMHDVLEHLVFSPYWYPTRNITRGEILPAVKADPRYLEDQGFDVLLNNQPINPAGINWHRVTSKNLRYKFRQRPGKKNSLGDVKFIFPNNYSVYLHDSNEKHLFDNSTRAFSHGCVRVEDPESLATALLEWDSGWQRDTVSRAMASGRQKYVKLGQTIPVYLVYFTATVRDGVLKFHDDLYGHDHRHTTKLKAQQENQRNTRVAHVLTRYQKSNAVPSSLSISMSASLKDLQNSGPTLAAANAR